MLLNKIKFMGTFRG